MAGSRLHGGGGGCRRQAREETGGVVPICRISCAMLELYLKPPGGSFINFRKEGTTSGSRPLTDILKIRMDRLDTARPVSVIRDNVVRADGGLTVAVRTEEEEMSSWHMSELHWSPSHLRHCPTFALGEGAELSPATSGPEFGEPLETRVGVD